MPILTNGVAPYAPASSIISIVERARARGLPSQLTKDVLIKSGVSESLVPRTLQALQLLDLTKEDGTWAPNLEILRSCPEAEVQTRFAEIIRSVYADVFQYVDPAEDSGTAVRDAFRGYTPHGQQDRMVSLFLALCQKAGIIKDAPPRAVKRENRAVKKPFIPNPQTRIKPPAGSIPAVGNLNLASPLSGLLATLPQGGSGWTQEARNKFVEVFQTMLDYCIPIREETEGDGE